MKTLKLEPIKSSQVKCPTCSQSYRGEGYCSVVCRALNNKTAKVIKGYYWGVGLVNRAIK